MTTVLVGVAGLAGVLARYGISRLTLHTEALVWSTWLKRAPQAA